MSQQNRTNLWVLMTAGNLPYIQQFWVYWNWSDQKTRKQQCIYVCKPVVLRQNSSIKVTLIDNMTARTMCDSINYYDNIIAKVWILNQLYKLLASCYPKLSYHKNINLKNADLIVTILIATHADVNNMPATRHIALWNILKYFQQM